MSFHDDPESALFRVSHPGLAKWQMARASLASAALFTNAVVVSIPALACLAFLGWALIGIHWLKGIRGSAIPFWPLIVVGGSVAAFGIFHAAVLQDVERLGLRFFSGAAWLFLLSTTVSWIDIKHVSGRWPVLRDLVDFADSSIGHGLILFRELERRREAAYLRLFRADKKHLELRELSMALAGGIDQALDRMTRVEEARTLRTTQSESESSGKSDRPALESTGVYISHGSTHRLKDFSFTVGKNEWIAVAGPSGAGKTTLLRMVSGLTPVSSGNLVRLGRAITGNEPLRQRVSPKVGLVCQDPHEQILGSTPLEDLILGLKARGVSNSESELRAREILSNLGIGELAERPVSRLSFGEQKRVAFAAILVCEPEILLCDEPTSGLDPVAAMRLIRLLEKVSANRSMAVLWATHDWNKLPRKIERVLLLNRGEAVFDGPCSEGFGKKRLLETGLEPCEENIE